MPAAPPDEFFPERPRRARDLLCSGLVLSAMGLVLGLLAYGREAARAIVLGVAFVTMIFLVWPGVSWLRRRLGLRAQSAGLIEVFLGRRRREHPWEDLEGLEEAASEDGLRFTVQTKAGPVQFDENVQGWERLAARIRAELQERAPQSNVAPAAARAPEADQLAAWLGVARTDLPHTLRYSFQTVRGLLYRWLAALAVLAIFGVLARWKDVGGIMWGSMIFMIFMPFIGASYRLILTWQRARRAHVTVTAEGLILVDHRGVERCYRWEDLLAVSEVKRERGVFPFLSPARDIQAIVSPKAMRIRTPWGYFEIDASLENYEALRNLIEQVIAARESPPAYPATRLAPSDAAISRARPGGTEVPTERALSRAAAPEEEKARLTGEVEEETWIELRQGLTWGGGTKRKEWKERRFIAMITLVFCCTTALLAVASMANAEGYVFEPLGEPVRSRSLNLSLVTRDPDGYYIAWAPYEAPDGLLLLGVRLDNGELIRVDLEPFGRSHLRLTRGLDGNLYLYSGDPGHFLRYDINQRELIDLGVPAKPANYWLGDAMGPDGRFWVGSYPQAILVSCDTQTGEIQDHGRIADDERQFYIIDTAASDDNLIYCAVGLHHRELWSYDPRTRTKAQILPDELTRDQGCPKVWTGTDGQVYGQAGQTTFRCRPDGIEVCEPPPARSDPDRLRAGDLLVGGIDGEGRLALTDMNTKEVRRVQTAYEGKANPIYCVGCERDGKVYGGSGSGASVFCYDTATGELQNLGQLTAGNIQVYDLINLPRGLFLSSYMGASLDFYDPDQPLESGRNPRHIASPAGQERPVQWALGPDGRLYVGTVPVKGRLGGALIQVNPDDFTFQVWPQIIPDQSIYYVAPVPETHELFCTTSIQGGTSAIPTEKEACVFLWDLKEEKVVFEAKPVPGTPTYGRAVRARTGILYGLAGNQYYAFDPQKREVVFVGDLPAGRVHFPGLNDEPVGPESLIYGLADDTVFAIDPADHSARIIARHESLRGAFGFHVTPEGVLYYGSGPMLMRCKLGKGDPHGQHPEPRPRQPAIPPDPRPQPDPRAGRGGGVG